MGNSQYQEPEAAFTNPSSPPWATPFPGNKTSKPVLKPSQAPALFHSSDRSWAHISKAEHPPDSPGSGLLRLDWVPGQKKVGPVERGKGREAELETPAVFYGARISAQRQMAWRLFEEQPGTDLEGVLCESHRQVPYYRSDVRGRGGGLECNLKGSNETLFININRFK